MRHKISQTLKTFGWQQWLVAAAFLLVLAFTGFYAFRAANNAIYWHYHADEPMQGWMTVGYVAHAYHVPPHILYQALGLPLKPPDKRTLLDIANAQNRSPDDVKAVLQDAIIHARPPYPPPAPPPPDDDRGAQ
ncbi:MAG: hypothetical protein ACR2N3_13440 [Pyrinomonadaceae bacterium]